MIALLLVACLSAEPDGREAEFAKAMTAVEFLGAFTVDGSAKDQELKTESYTIRKVEKLPQEDLWRFVARVRYGETDVELPMDLPVKWAGGTPVITLDNVWLPGLGTFSARVVIHDQKYAGTWRHDEKGGHLFGVIKPKEQEVAVTSETSEKSPKESEPISKEPASKP
jgi:hypothetical protein